MMAALEHRIRMRSPAKLNLYLEITGKRPDGYHELRMLNTGLDLADIVNVEISPDRNIQILCEAPGVPLGPDNLCARAAEVFFRAFPQTRTGLRITIEKRIPVAGGLGGGSSNAAAALFALSRLCKPELGTEDLIRLGAQVGADVPFFLFRSPAWVSGIGDVLSDAPPLPAYTFLIVRQDFGVSTAEAFAQYDLTKRDNRDNLNDSKNIKIAPQDFISRNDLEAVAATYFPRITQAKTELLEAGAIGAMMTGSGPTVFGVFSDRMSAVRACELVGRSLKREMVLSQGLEGPLLIEC